jgi:hypothetical protein
MQDNSCDDVSGDSACSSEISLLGHVNVGHVLVLAEEGKVEDDLKRFSVCSQHNQISNSSVQAFCGLISSLLQLLVENCLVAEIQDLLAHLVVSLGPGSALLLNLFLSLITLFSVHIDASVYLITI